MIALLPMKANSERVPNKNFRVIAGKPLFAWILDTLLKLDFLDQIVINTDADLNVFGDYLKNKKIFFRVRKSELRGDFVSMNKILEDDILECNSNHYLMTHTTNPVLSARTIIEANKVFKSRDRLKNDTLFSVTRFQGRFYREDFSAINHNPNELLRTQDLPAMYFENSCLYLFSQEDFFLNNARIGKKPIMFETPQLESIDIDTEIDWFIAEAVLQKENRPE